MDDDVVGTGTLLPVTGSPTATHLWLRHCPTNAGHALCDTLDLPALRARTQLGRGNLAWSTNSEIVDRLPHILGEGMIRRDLAEFIGHVVCLRRPPRRATPL